MKLITCLSNQNGLCYGKRRLTKDKSVIVDISKTVGENKIYMTAYSTSMFAEFGYHNSTMDGNFMEHAQKEEYVFVESPQYFVWDNVDVLIIYNWNQSYPATSFLDKIPKEFKLEKRMSFAGETHSKITKDVYVKTRG